jgi:hypothetical protein
MRPGRALIAVIALALPSVAQAQKGDTVRITVSVVNQLGFPVRTAEVAARTRDGTIVTRAQSDSTGRAVLIFMKADSIEQLFTRKLGFDPMALPVPYPLEQSNSVFVLLMDAEAQTLDTVRTNSTQALHRRLYFIDSATIARSPVYIHDGWDVLKKLRPDIAYGRDPACPSVQELYINGVWVIPEEISIDPIVLSRETGVSPLDAPRVAAAAMMNGVRNGHHLQVMSALALIKPEHIAQITFRNCREKPIAGNHSVSAAFVVLKDNIAFDPRTGSFPIRP